MLENFLNLCNIQKSESTTEYFLSTTDMVQLHVRTISGLTDINFVLQIKVSTSQI